jgi:hypothetical protein
MKFKATINAIDMRVGSNELFEIIKTQADYDNAIRLMEKFINEEDGIMEVEFDTETGSATLLEVEEL